MHASFLVIIKRDEGMRGEIKKRVISDEGRCELEEKINIKVVVVNLRIMFVNLKVSESKPAHCTEQYSHRVTVLHIYVQRAAYIYPACCIYICSKRRYRTPPKGT